MIPLLITLIAITSSGVAAMIANFKGRDVGNFAIFGLFLGPLAILYVAAGSRGDDPEYLKWRAEREERKARLREDA